MTYVFQLGLAEGRAVGGDEDQLGLAGADGLHGGLGAHGDLAGLHDQGETGGDAAVVSAVMTRKRQAHTNRRPS